MAGYLELEMHKNPAEILVVFFQAVIEGFDVFLFEETDHALL